MIAWFRNNLIVVGNQTSRNTVNIYDMKNKFTAFTNTYVNITHVLSEWGIIFILTKDGKAYQLKETDTQSKLEILYNKHYYQLAINLASTQQYDYNSIVDIYRKYGDHLYGYPFFSLFVFPYSRSFFLLSPVSSVLPLYALYLLLSSYSFIFYPFYSFNHYFPFPFLLP